MDAVQLHNVGMVAERAQEHDLAKGALRISFVAERVKDLLDRHRLLGFLVQRLPHDSVGAFAETLSNEERNYK